MTVYKWMEEIQVVEGYNRACLFDLNRCDYQFISKDILELISRIDGRSQKDLKIEINELEWFNDFKQKEYFFEIPKKLFGNFSKLSLEWESPSFIINAIIHESDKLPRYIQLIDELLCKHIAIYTKTITSLKEIILNNFLVSNFHSVNFILEDDEEYDADILNTLKDEYPIIGRVDLLKNIVSNQTQNSFVINSLIFSESQNFNPFFNRRLYIGKNGEIKNSSESSQIFGNIENDIDKLKKIIQSNEFNEIGRIKKELIDVCKSCEFRFVCLDNRIPIKRNENEYYFNEECNYNPFISKWKEEDGYLTLKECGVHSNESEYKINHDLILEINKKLWESI